MANQLDTDPHKSSIDENYDRNAGKFLSAAEEEAAIQSTAGAGIDQLEQYGNDPKNHKPGWDASGVRGKQTAAKPQKFAGKALDFIKKRKGILAIGGGIGLGGGLLVSLFSPIAMVTALYEQISFKNDSSSVASERRILKVLGVAGGDQDPGCATKKNIKCRAGRLSNKALNQLDKKGITAKFGDTAYDGKTRKGYPDSRPTSYEFKDADGKVIRNVPAGELKGFLAEKGNFKFARQMYGVNGAFKLKYKMWSGKHMASKFYGNFKLSRLGGLFDGMNEKGKSASDRLKAAADKMKKKIPGASAINDAANTVKEKVSKQTGKAKKGGAAYMLAVGGCVSIKAPIYIAAAVAGVQILQVMPFFMDIIASPAGKQKTSGVYPEANLTSEDLETAGTLLTSTKKDEATGKNLSALDSPALQAAMGVNTAPVTLQTDYIPGYAALTNPIVLGAIGADKATKDTCSAIMSPTAMYTAMAVDVATTAAAAPTIVGGIVKVAASFIISYAVGIVVTEIAGGVAKEVIADIATNDKITNAEGVELGHVLGNSAMAFFSAGGMANYLPGLTQAQLADYQQVKLASQEDERRGDIAILSPFDTSSRYTLFGSIVNNARVAALANGGVTMFSAIPSLFKLPLSFASSTQAASGDTDYCGYADKFQMSTGDPATTPAINAAGLPCTGITSTQAAMSTEEAIELVSGEGWIDTEADIQDGATIEDLVKSGVIKKDTPLSDFIEDCTEAYTGDYVINSTGCANATSSPAATEFNSSNPCVPNGAGGTSCASDAEEGDGFGGATPVTNSRALQAIPVFLMDYRLLQSINGEDDEPVGGGSSPQSTGKIVMPVAEGWVSTDEMGPRSSPCSGCSSWHQGLDLVNGSNPAVYAMSDGEVISISGGNNVVTIRHANNLLTNYFHMFASDITVKVGDKVTAGQTIGKIGNAGDSTGAHLHFEVDISEVADKSQYAQYEINSGGFNPGERVNPRTFLKMNGVPGV